MTMVVNEPQVDYEIDRWYPDPEAFHLGESICKMDTDSVFFCPPSGSRQIVFAEKPKRRLSLLRGKMTKQSEKEIDNQITDLRNEWDRSI